MPDIIPTHLGGYVSDGGNLSNDLLRIGTVQAIHWPEDAKNVSKKFVEFSVYVQERSNGTAGSRMYDHCIAIDSFGSVADTFHATYRADPSAGRKDAELGLGAKVLILCINAEQTNPVILGAIRDSASTKDTKDLGHHLRFKYNGVDIDIDKTGQLKLAVHGATDLKGVPVKADVGTTITVALDGSVTIKAKTIKHGGPSSNEPVPLGNVLVDTLSKILQEIEKIQVFTAVGVSSQPANTPAFEAIRLQLNQILSTFVFTQKNPD